VRVGRRARRVLVFGGCALAGLTVGHLFVSGGGHPQPHTSSYATPVPSPPALIAHARARPRVQLRHPRRPARPRVIPVARRVAPVTPAKVPVAPTASARAATPPAAPTTAPAPVTHPHVDRAALEFQTP
jgi:hypothetical protein